MPAQIQGISFVIKACEKFTHRFGKFFRKADSGNGRSPSSNGRAWMPTDYGSVRASLPPKAANVTAKVRCSQTIAREEVRT